MNTPVDSFLQSAWKIHQSGGTAQAHQMYRQVVDQVPDHANAWCYLGIALHDLKRYREAIDAYQKAIALQPIFPIAYNNLGNSLRYDFRRKKPNKHFKSARIRSPIFERL